MNPAVVCINTIGKDNWLKLSAEQKSAMMKLALSHKPLVLTETPVEVKPVEKVEIVKSKKSKKKVEDKGLSLDEVVEVLAEPVTEKVETAVEEVKPIEETPVETKETEVKPVEVETVKEDSVKEIKTEKSVKTKKKSNKK